MDYRTAEILALTDLATSGTKLIDINLADPISQLVINYEIAVGAGDRLAHISDMFDKVEIIDGSDILVSLRGSHMRGLEYLLHDEVGQEYCTVNQSARDYGRLTYNFGRYLWDEELAFDPTRFRNPQIRIKWDVATVEANATDADIEIFAQMFDQKMVSPVGFLQTKVYEEYTPSGGAWRYIDLPTDYPYRMLFLTGYGKDHGLGTFFDTIKLSENVDERVPYDLSLADIVALNARKFGLMVDTWEFTGNNKSWTGAFVPCYGAVTGHSASDEGNVTNISTADGGHLLVSTGVDSATKIEGTYTGLVPLGVIAIPVCDEDEIGEFWDVRGLRNLQLQVKAAGSPPSGHNAFVIVQQLRS